MKILVTGACGQLGSSIRRLARNSPHKFIFTDIAEAEGVTRLDITNEAELKAFVADNKPDCLINCAAYTNVDKAESDLQTADLLNNTAVRYMAEAMRDAGGFMIHVSTDYVFGGDGNTPRKEDDPTNPLGVYGATKLAGEEALRKTLPQHFIVRTAWLYSEYGKNFLKTMAQLTASKEQLKVVFDQVGTPTYAGDLAQALLAIADAQTEGANRTYGTYHFSNEGVCSWYDFALLTRDLFGNTKCDMQPCHSDEFPSPVTRPAYSVLDKTKIKTTFGITIPHWATSVRICAENLKKQS